MPYSDSISWTVARVLVASLLLVASTNLGAQGNTKESADLPSYTGSSGESPVSVNSSTGQLNVSIPVISVPGLDGEGYQLTLNYTPPTPNAEASWVGYGWSLSPGSIQRSQNGIADDFKGEIINISKKPKYVRLTGRLVGGVEILSLINGGLGMGAVWDSDRGVLPSVSLSLSGFGAGISYLKEGGDGTFSVGFNPVSAILAIDKVASKGSGDKVDVDKSLKQAMQEAKNGDLDPDLASAINNVSASDMFKKKMESKLIGVLSAPYGLNSRGMLSMPAYENAVTGHSAGFTGSVQISTLPDIGFEVGFDTKWTEMEYTMVDEAKKVTGYMRGGERETGMDFSQERLNVLDEYDKFIATPVAMPDQFSVSAQGLSGSFRAHFSEPGSFHPDPIDYDVSQGPTVGLEFAAGLVPPYGNLTGGASVSAGLGNTMDIESWDVDGGWEFGEYKKDIFFAFDGAPNMERAYADAADVLHAKKDGSHKKLKLSQTLDGPDPMDRVVQSKWVRWNTLKESKESHVNDGWARYPKRFCNQDLSAGAIDAFRGAMDEDHIGEFQVVNENGLIYTFGIPVLVRNQVECSFSIPDGITPSSGALEDYKVVMADAPAIGKYLAGHQTIEEVLEDHESDIITGRIVEPAIATSYLLTSIVSPDYVDLTLDGPTEDDLGTWVKFEYVKDFGEGAAAGWFKYRSPLWGNYFSEGNAADARDDVGSFSYGEKEVYRLASIETRTHIAKLHGSARTTDGKGVADLDAASNGVSTSPSASTRLDSISLFAKSSPSDDLLRRIHFDYSGPSLKTGVQGSVTTSCLTLSGLTVQPHDVVEEENQAHYAFSYLYPASSPLPTGLQSRYDHLFSEYFGFSSAAQNPPFSFNATDAWGNHKLTSPSEFDVHQSWLDLREWSPGSTSHDPAAYALKEITMPGGMTVYPQYEAGDYRYVQDEPACIMVPLLGTSTDDTYVLNLSAVDADGGMTASEKADFLQDYFDGRKVYYKVRYSLNSSSIEKYFTGFAPVDNVTVDGTNIRIHLDGSGEDGTPRKVCLDYVEKFPKVSNGNADEEGPSDDIETAVHEFIQELANPIDFLGACTNLDATESFVRIPLFPGMEKTGGGLRVKRLMTFDEGLETDDAMLSGTIFEYTELDPLTGERVSSGVAANEPRSIYDEYGKFTPLPKGSQTWYQKATQGKDAEKQTGPIGESFLPGPQVLYGEVVKRHIHDGESTIGHSVESFHTHREHPTQISWSDEQNTQLKHVDQQLPFGVYNQTTQELWYSQGFQVEHSLMPGQSKGQTSYGGQYDDVNTWYPVASTTYDYFEKDELLPLMDKWSADVKDQPHFDELYFHGRKVETKQSSGSLEADLSVQFPAPIPIPVFVPSGFASYSEMNQVQAAHGTTRIVSKPLFMKAITRTETGKVTRMENLAFDPITLEPVVKSTSDGYTGLAFEHNGIAGLESAWEHQRIGYTFPAHRWYPELGGKYHNDRQCFVSGADEFEGFSIKKMNSVFVGDNLLICLDGADNYCDRDVMGLFHPGDLLRVTEKNGSGANDDNYYHVSNISGNRVFLHRSELFDNQSWTSNVGDNDKDANVEVISSGAKNQLRLPSGSIEVYDDALSVDQIARINTELAGLIDAMNSARPALPSGSTTTGIADLHGASEFSDTLKIQEEDCKQVKDLCALQYFAVGFHDAGCGLGYIAYPVQSSAASSGFNISILDKDNSNGINEIVYVPVDSTCPPFRLIPIRFNADQANGGEFQFDHDLGAIVWVTDDNPCNPVVVFTPCRDLSKKIVVENVIQSEELVLRDDVEFEHLLSGQDPYESGERGRWKQHSSWVAQSDASSWDDPDVHHSRQSGILDVYEALNEDFADYMVPPFVELDDHPWIRQSKSTLYDRRGHALETEDALGLHQSKEYGAQEKLVTWESEGARNASCLFESCERNQSGLLSDSKLDLSGFSYGNWTLLGHTGLFSIRLNVQAGTTRDMRIGQITLDERCTEDDGGVEVRFWVRELKDPSTGQKKYTMSDLFTASLVERGSTYPADGSTPASTGSPSLSTTGAPISVSVDSINQTGPWVLMEARFASADIAKPTETPMVVELEWDADVGGKVFMDDVRIRPFNSIMTCRVHDGRDFKLLAEFNNNHFATKYQYNRMDELIRVQVETASGWKTVSEEIPHTKLD